MKKLIILPLLIVLFLISAYAELEVDIESVDNSIYLDEQAKFTLKLSNTDETSKVVQVYSPNVEWYVQLEPFITNLKGNESVELELSLLPSVWAEEGPQKVTVMVESPTMQEKIQVELLVFVKSFDEGKKVYRPSVELRVTFPDEVDPRESIPISIYLRNRNRLDIDEMDLIIESKVFSEYKKLSLDPLSETREKISFTIDKLTKPTDDQLDVAIKIDNKTVNRERIDFTVITYSTFLQDVEVIEELFKTSKEYKITNEGNIPKYDAVRVQTSFLKKFFTSTKPSPNTVKLGKQAYLEWNFNLEPYEETTVMVVENYRPIIYIVLIAIIVTLVYFLYRSPVIIKKEAIITGSNSDGISDMKVLLHIRNRGQDLIENVNITDWIPSIAEHVKESHVGTLAPKKILKHLKRGTIIKWEIDALEPFEERIISYRLKSKIAIVGGLTLPHSKIKFETDKGQERTVTSNRSKINFGL